MSYLKVKCRARLAARAPQKIATWRQLLEGRTPKDDVRPS
jgi:hypothetical protein